MTKTENEKRLSCDFVKIAQKQAIKDFVEKLKEYVNTFEANGNNFDGKGADDIIEIIDEFLEEYVKEVEK